jgi:hypothetical protein
MSTIVYRAHAVRPSPFTYTNASMAYTNDSFTHAKASFAYMNDVFAYTTQLTCPQLTSFFAHTNKSLTSTSGRIRIRLAIDSQQVR